MKIIKTTGSILVHRNVMDVFDFFANPSNDNSWRSEINSSILSDNLQKGVCIKEYSKLSRKAANHLTELECIEFEKNFKAVFATVERSPFYLKSHRETRVVSESCTEVIYELEFDSAIVKFALGFNLPAFIISIKANNDMKKYLKQLAAKLNNK
jgi:hypothetical protein